MEKNNNENNNELNLDELEKVPGGLLSGKNGVPETTKKMAVSNKTVFSVKNGGKKSVDKIG